MTVHAYDLLKPVCDQMLPALANMIGKAEADAAQRNIEEHVLLDARLAPDMFAFARQVQIATDLVKGGFSRLAGQESPSWADDESSFADLKARIAKTVEHVGTFTREQLDDSAGRDIVLNFPGVTFNFKGEEYLLNFVLPNFYFHMTTAYAILRHNGVGLGKKDYLGG
ncbi:MAG TPA: DUF1993 domain-containing protein [Gammaproteobacteria bacterium]|nr:DUF1993 domain-containing protein [Gammaproteobacteria bacterium]